MDPEYSLQDVVRCHLCETPVPPLHCVICKEHLCEDCEGKHLSDKSKEHKVVTFKYRESFPSCQIHFTKICEFCCKQCDIPICSLCLSSTKHQTHEAFDILEILESKRNALKKDLQYLKEFIYPKYQEMACDIRDQKSHLNENLKKLTTEIDNYKENLYTVVDKIIRKLKFKLKKIDSKQRTSLDFQEGLLKHIISEMKQIIDDERELVRSCNGSRVSAKLSEINKFRIRTPKLKFFLPSFTPQRINKKKIYHQLGLQSVLFIKPEEQYYTMDIPFAESFPTKRPNINLQVTTIKKIKQKRLRSLSCLNDEAIWTCGSDSMLRLYNLQGVQIESMQTRSGKRPVDIAVTRSGDLVYTDRDNRTVNIVKNTQIQTVIRLLGWKPWGVCCTSSGDLLVVMDSDDRKQTKVVRYSGSTEKPSIQYDDKGQPLYSAGDIKYISENRNQDVCVSDNEAHAIVVVNQAGKFRFTYTGLSSSTKENFHPFGITTDSQGRILTVDRDDSRIHILDQDGQFLRYICDYHIYDPWGICVDIRDNLFVAEWETGQVKKIQYKV